MENTTLLMLWVLYSSLWMWYFIYGKKASRVIPLICGAILMIFPYFTKNVVSMNMLGIIFLMIPFFIRLDM